MIFFKPKKPPLRSVLFVCTANQTRSVTAMALFRRLAEKSTEKWIVDSAGAKASNGAMAHPVISHQLKRMDAPVNDHRSKPVSKKLLSRFRWIIVMEQAHKDAIVKLDKEAGERTFLMRELSSGEELKNYDMPDPTGNEYENYKELFDIMDAEIPRLFEKLQIKAYDEEWNERKD